MPSQTLILQNPIFSLNNSTTDSAPVTIHHFCHRSLFRLSTTPRAISLSVFRNKKISVNCANHTSSAELLIGSTRTVTTRTVTTLVAIALTASKFIAQKVAFSLISQSGFQGALISTAGPAFFAAARDSVTGTVSTPFTVVAAGMAKWLDIYSGVLMVRVLLSWFPNIPWDKQPLSAIRDLCDPYLNLFRNIIPPIFDTLDVSPLLAFAVLGTLGSILNSSRVIKRG